MLTRQKINFRPSKVQSSEQNLMFQSPQMHAILKLKYKYQKSVQQTVNVIQNLSFNKMPQKCLLHNNNFTLYCQNDQKPLCASCIYQNQTHKHHKVLPINNCLDLIKRDGDKLQKQLGFILQNINGLIKHVIQGIQKVDKQFPYLIIKVQDNYKQLHNYLCQRQKQHLNELRYYKQRVKYQHGALSVQLNKITLFIQQKIQQYSRKHDLQLILTKRNVYDSLKNSTKIVGDELNIKEEAEPKLNFFVFNEIEQFINAKLNNLFCKQTKKSELNKNNIYGSRRKNQQMHQYRMSLSNSLKKLRSQQKNRSITPPRPKKKSESKQNNQTSKQKQKKKINKTSLSQKGSKTPPNRNEKSRKNSNLKTQQKQQKKSSNKKLATRSRSRNQSPQRL